MQKNPFGWSLRAGLGLCRVLVGLLVFSATVGPQVVRVGAEDMDCESDPPIVVTANDGHRLYFDVWYRASSQLTPARHAWIVDVNNHLLLQSKRWQVSAIRTTGTYEVEVDTVVQPWSDGTVFPVSAYLLHPTSLQVSNTDTELTGKTMKLHISVPVSAVP